MKVLILYNKLFHYRIPVWNLLAERCDLTVAYSEGDGSIPNGMPCKFQVLHLPSRTYGSRVVVHKPNIRRMAKDYDVVVAYGNIAWLKYSTLPWFNKTKVVFHTLGVSASYSKGYDENKGWDRIRTFFYRKANALAFYTDYPIQKYEKLGIPKDRMFVANNTVYVEPTKENLRKDSILFIGTLYREKGIQLILDTYFKLKGQIKLPSLYIIGNGPDFESIRNWIVEKKMDDTIHLEGAIYDIHEKAKYFARSLACISPKQAGLTVLESMGYGVPFITSKNAITGGEVFNVHDGKDGVIFQKEEDLVSIIKEIAINPDKYKKLGEEAKKYYDNNATIRHMADGLWKAITYAYNH